MDVWLGVYKSSVQMATKVGKPGSVCIHYQRLVSPSDGQDTALLTEAVGVREVNTFRGRLN